MSNMVAVFVANTAWSMLGLTIGFALGRLTREMHEVHEALAPMEERLHMIEHPPHPYRRSGDKTRTRDRIVATVVIFLSVISVVASSIAVSKKSALSECQADYNERVVNALNARATANDKDRAAIVTLVRNVSISNGTEMPSETRRTATQQYLLEYVKQADAAAATRRANPLPLPPDTNCRK